MTDWNSNDAASTASSAAAAAPGPQQQLTFATSSSSAAAALLPHRTTSASALNELLPEAPRGVSISVDVEGTRHKDVLVARSSALHHPLAGVRIGDRLAGDVMVAAAVTGAVSPFLTVVDKAIVQRAAGSHTVLQSARASLTSLVSQPIQYLRSPTFLWMWATYASTYSAANALRTVTEQLEYDSLSRSTASHERQKRATPAALFVGTTVVNSTASLVKDRAYAQMFGANAGAAPSIPKVSYALWVARDLTVIGSSFVLPAYVGQHLQDRHGWNADSAAKFAQVATPMAAQLVAGPLHYVGLDCFTRPLPASGVSSTTTMSSLLFNAKNRAQQLLKAAPEVITARMVRILPAYGVTGVYNTQLRNSYRSYLIERKVRDLMAREAEAVAAAAPAVIPRRTTTNDLAALIRAQSVRRNGDPRL